MGIQVIDHWGNSNPSGIVINYGYYALAEAILTEHRIYDIMRRWCNVVDALPDPLPIIPKPKKKKKPKVVRVLKTDKIIALYRKNPKLQNIQIAKKVGCTEEMVGKALRKIGIRRNRWEGYISKDPRYSKEKRRMLNAKAL